ncbi:SLC13 family permease [[Clostridium] hylemonae]|uniref:SLC13 family permease n=1 Tax=[Clostridium] hylemonae TaxID=89153 RepID=UPI001FCBA166|nr:SLC13 family permease [[Clostridium] hylemonae]BDF05715.1 sodium:sulfate symporter [[Clostridium] hylemonae]
MTLKRRFIYILAGPVIFALTVLLLSNALTMRGAQAVGVAFWLIFWWITRPVHITITGIMPVVANAVFNIVPMASVTAQYASDSIILIFGSTLICLPWKACGLDRRVALKALSLIGPSMKSQITVWLLASIALSMALPNVMVCALFTPIAIAMLSAAGYDDIPTCAPAVPILLAIGWGVSLGGAGTPLGGAMNLVAISYLEELTGHEFMYIDWVIRIAPYLIIASLVLLGSMLLMPMKVKKLDGTREYFNNSYRELGPMKRDEKICSILFLVAMLAAFTRPLYADILPALAPAYVYLTLGCLCFFIVAADKGFLLTWDTAQNGMMWGMMILFAGGMALGKLINDSGATARIADIVSGLALDGGLLTIVILVVFTRIISEVTNGTTAAAVSIPIVFGFTSELGLNPIPYWFITTLAYNAEFLLPLSVRAIPVAYGLDANKMLKAGTPMTIISMVVVIIFGYLAMQFWPAFGELSYLVN